MMAHARSVPSTVAILSAITGPLIINATTTAISFFIPNTLLTP